MRYDILLILSLIFFAVSCNNPQKEKPGDQSLVVSYTSGKIDPARYIEITFKKSPDLFKDLSEKERNNVISLDPPVEGVVFLKNEKTLIFKPVKPLPFKSKFKVKVHLDKLYSDPPDETFTFEIETLPLYYSFEFEGIKINPAGKENFVQLTGVMGTSASVDLERLKAVIQATQNGVRLPVSISEKKYNTYEIVVDSVVRDKKPGEVKIFVEGTALGAESNWEGEFTVPALNDFSLVQYKIVKTPEKYVELVFSDLPDPSMQLDGLIYFKSGVKSKISLKDNVIKLYPLQAVEGKEILIVSRAVRNGKGVRLDKDYALELFFEQEPPAVRFAGKGNILVGNDDWNIPFEAVNLRSLDVVVFKIYANNIRQFLQMTDLDGFSWQMDRVGEFIAHQKIWLDTTATEPDNHWKSYSLDLSKMIRSEPGAVYRVALKFRKEDALLSCENSGITQLSEETSRFDSAAYFYNNYYYPENFNWQERQDFCTDSYYYSDRFVSRNFLATNIGLIVKSNGENQYQVFVRDLMTAEPRADVDLLFYTYQHQLIKKVKSDGEGMAGVTLEKEPFLLVAQSGSQFGYLKLRKGNALSYSKFAVDGVRAENGLKGFLFGERGVWRPGDTLFLTFLLDDRQKVLPAGHPVSLKVYDALDKPVYSEVHNQGQDGFYVFRVPTSPEAPTGFWRAVVSIGNSAFKKTIRVETVLPNRLKIEMKASGDKLYKGNNKIYLTARWLHGAAAANLKADVTETISPKKTVFKGYENFVFDDPSRSFYPDERVVFDGKLDANGRAVFSVYEPERKELPSSLRMNFVAKVYEAGGRFSIEEKEFEYYPYHLYVGIKSPAVEAADYLETGKEHKFTVVTLDEKGNKISASDLTVEIYKLEWSWWYHSGENNLAYYLSRHSESLVSKSKLSTRNGTGYFTFKVTDPDWGKYFIKVYDKNGGGGSGMVVYFDWPDTYSRQNRPRQDAMLLSLSMDKDRYRVGETARLSFPSSTGGRALISLEKNDKILKSWWVETMPKTTFVEFEVTEAMAPNVYAFVSVVQPYDQTVNDLPIRSYGVIPVFVKNEKVVLKPEIEAPQIIKPESAYRIQIKEKNGRPMSYVLAVVDEGLLNLTGFKTPSPLKHFYAKEALAVNTWDYYDFVMAAYGRRISQVFAIGGSDGERKILKKKNLSRFKPEVTFLGPFHLDKGENNTHRLKMGNYLGSVRVMVVAADGQGAFGHAEKEIKVKTPLMVLASLPRKLVPGEELEVPVTLFVMDDRFKKVKLTVQTNDLFEVEKEKTGLHFDKTGEYVVMVKIKVKEKTGVGKLDISVTSKGEKAHYQTEAEIRIPGKRIYKTAKFTLEPSESIAVRPEFPDKCYDKQADLTVYSIPPIHLKKRLDYLLKYPYGCAEQLVSTAFPQLYLDKLTALTSVQKKKASDNVSRVIKKLRDYQTYDGGFAYWPDSYAEANEWVTGYAGQFLLLAEESGYYVPQNMMRQWKRYQRAKAGRWVNRGKADDLTQAYRLYTLALAQSADFSAMNRMREDKSLSATATLRLAAAYAVVGRNDVAEALIAEAKTRKDTGSSGYDTFGSEIRDEALCLETYLLTGKENEAAESFRHLATALGSNRWMSTQTTAFALYAAALYVDENATSQPLKLEYASGKAFEQVSTDKPVFAVSISPDALLKVNNLSSGKEYVTVTTSWLGTPGTYYNEESGITLKVNYYGMDGRPLDVFELKQGTDFYARITVRNQTFRNINHLALSVPVPSGWELLNTRLFDVGSSFRSSESNYFDFRDERVDIFFDLSKNESKTYFILFNAAYPGNYFIMPVTCSAMYDNQIYGAMGGGHVTVKK